MALSFLDNVDYRGKKPNFTRDLFETKAEMVAFSENYLPDVFVACCKEDGKAYIFNRNNDVDETLGKWRNFQGTDIELAQSNWDETDETSVAYILNKPEFNELTEDDIKNMLGLSEEELEGLASLISDSEVRLDKTYSSSKIYTDIIQCLEDSKTYTSEQIAKVIGASYKVVTSVDQMTDDRVLYLLKNTDDELYDIYIYDKDVTSAELIGSFDINLEDYVTQVKFDELSEEVTDLKKSVSDGKIAVAGAITDNGVETATDATFEEIATNVNVLVEKIKVPNGSEWTLLSEYEKSPSIYYENMWFMRLNNQLYYSENGLNWELAKLDSGDYIDASNYLVPVYIPDLNIWVTKRASGNIEGLITYYSDDGKIWYESNIKNTEITTLCYGKGVLIGTNTFKNVSGIYYTTDGKNWELVSEKNSSSSSYINNISLVGNMFFATVSGGTNSSYPSRYSFDGKIWNTHDVSYNGFCYINGLYYAASSSSTCWSSDGINWTPCTITLNTTTYGRTFSKILYNRGLFVATTYGGIFYSTDGKTWTSSNLKSGCYTVFYNKRIWVAFGVGGPSTGYGLYYSEDGMNWVENGFNSTSFSNVNEYKNRIFFTANNSLYTSDDNKTWTPTTTSSIKCYINGIFISSDFKSSIDGINWKQSNIDLTSGNIYYGNGLWLLLSSKKIYYSRTTMLIEKE